MAKEIYVATSGWMYKSWAKKFYPSGLKKGHLSFYSKTFDSVEINSSFYRMPTEKSFSKWRKETPGGFIFSVKLNRYLTHRKKLILDEESLPFLREFLLSQNFLGKKLGVLLVQLPPGFRRNDDRLAYFLGRLRKYYRKNVAVEFRHPSWFQSSVYEILKDKKCALVWTHSNVFPVEKIFTADFAYLRFHGPGDLFSSRYEKSELERWKKEIEAFPPEIKRVYVYFNNDYRSFAVENAAYLREILASKSKK